MENYTIRGNKILTREENAAVITWADFLVKSGTVDVPLSVVSQHIAQNPALVAMAMQLQADMAKNLKTEVTKLADDFAGNYVKMLTQTAPEPAPPARDAVQELAHRTADEYFATHSGRFIEAMSRDKAKQWGEELAQERAKLKLASADTGRS